MEPDMVVTFWRPENEEKRGLDVTVIEASCNTDSSPKQFLNLGFLSITTEPDIESNAVNPEIYQFRTYRDLKITQNSSER
jgi:hypothetical protein